MSSHALSLGNTTWNKRRLGINTRPILWRAYLLGRRNARKGVGRRSLKTGGLRNVLVPQETGLPHRDPIGQSARRVSDTTPVYG